MAPSRAATHPTDGDPAASKPDCDTPAHAGTDLPTHAGGEPERHANPNTDADAHVGALAEPDGDAPSDTNANARSVVHDNGGLETNRFSAWPTPTPSPGTDLILYLHNNPTPPEGDTESHDILPMDPDQPRAPVLYNYDVDRDASPGPLIAKGGSAPHESDPTKYQAWLTPAFPAATVVEGDVTVKLWSAMKTSTVRRAERLRIPAGLRRMELR